MRPQFAPQLSIAVGMVLIMGLSGDAFALFADVVNYLRTNFGNRLEGDATADDVARVRHE